MRTRKNDKIAFCKMLTPANTHWKKMYSNSCLSVRNNKTLGFSTPKVTIFDYKSYKPTSWLKPLVNTSKVVQHIHSTTL